MKNRTNQIYEEYWKYTAEWTDTNGEKFIEGLKECVDFIDQRKITTYSPELYEELQERVMCKTSITAPSARKAINQMVKIGFLKPYLGGYVPEAKQYLDARTDIRRTNILSKVVYSYSNFQNSITDPDYGGTAVQIKFLLNTLEEVGAIDTPALYALMTTKISDYPRGYLLKKELDELYVKVKDIDFDDRKYNQMGHLRSLLKRMDDLCVHNKVIYFKTDAERMFGDEETKKEVRDPYLQRVYKSELEEESCIHYECETPKCMLEGLTHPVLIASHIKPYISCKDDKDAQFDVNNGLLLSKNLDSLFDLGYITFDDEGAIIPSKVLDENMVSYMSQFRLHKDFINKKRMEYMQYHRNHVFEKKYSRHNVRKYIL